MHNLTIKELAHGLQSGDFSSTELTQEYLKRIKALNPQVNSFITICEEEALAQAKAADVAIAKGNAHKLAGIPIAHKDIFCTKGVKTTCGSKMLDNFIAPYNATLIEKFNAANMVCLGKTNMDEFAMGSSNETSFYGAVKNPFDLNKSPGGSSGGAAAAVAALMAPGSTGTDTGGSIRQPASLCGVTGLKPTYGRVSRYGMIAFASSLDQGGPIAKTAQDAALLLEVMSGFDKMDSTSSDKAVPDYSLSLDKDIKGMKIGLVKEFFDNRLDSNIASNIENAVKELEKQGAIITEISLPNSALSVPVYYVIASAECSSNLSRYDGVKYGYRCEEPKDLLDLYMRTREIGFGEEVKRRILIGTYTLSAGYYDAYYLKAQKVRRLIANDFANAFKDVDLILGPTSPCVAFNIGEKISDPVSMYLSDIYTIAVNLAGLPGISIPSGMVNNLPVGLQLIGNHFCEEKLLNVAHKFQQATDYHKQLPELI